MDCRTWQEQFKEWLSLYWLHDNTGIEFPGELENHAEGCKACSMRLKSAAMLFRNAWPGIQVPDGLSERVSNFILEKYSRKKPRRYSRVLIPLAAAAVILVTFFFTLTFFSQSYNTITIHLMINVPDATSVSVVGDWNGWKPEIDMLSDPDNDGIWEIRLHLFRNNEYRYQFLIDGKEWIPDPASPLKVDDGFGGINSILEI